MGVKIRGGYQKFELNRTYEVNRWIQSIALCIGAGSSHFQNMPLFLS